METTIDSHTLTVLEFDKVLNFLCRFAVTELGKEFCHNTLPQTNSSLVKERLHEVSEMRSHLGIHGAFPFDHVTNITPLLQKTEPEGAALFACELWEIYTSLQSSRLVKEFVYQVKEQFPALWGIAKKLKVLFPMEKEIAKAVNAEGNILDSASEKLEKIRKKTKTVKKHIKFFLEDILNHPETNSFIQEKFITLRHDRYVIPLKADFKKRIPGIIHDQSHNQTTYFVEPFKVVEFNNELTVLKEEEKREEVRILKALTALVGGERNTLLENQKNLGRLDEIQARALMSEAMNAREPELVKEKDINLLSARNPLLLHNFSPGNSDSPPRFDNKAVTPIDIRFMSFYFGMIITGSNMGGKTATLKTLGLLSLMTQAGMHIPVVEGSRLPVWEKIFADIGDEQNLEESISTFSSHMSHLNKVLDHADENSLVILDEIGSGTDPEEGGALGMAILDELRGRETKVVLTSHLNLLKAYGVSHDDVLNVSVEFNSLTLKPTFKLLYGIPGTSKALETASRLGISSHILLKAKDYLKEYDRTILFLIEKLELIIQKIIKIKIDLGETLLKASHFKEIIAQFVEKIKNKQHALLSDSEEKVRKLFLEVEMDLKRTKKSPSSTESLKKIKKKWSSSKEKILHNFISPQPPANQLLELKKGDHLSFSNEKEGRVIGLDHSSKRVEIQTGGLRLKTKVEELHRIAGAQITFPQKTKGEFYSINATSYESSGALSSLNLVGLTIDEAIPRLEKYVDNGLRYGIKELRVIHGVGTGRLRHAIHVYLKNRKGIEKYYLGTLHQGGAGVTIVELQ